MDPRTIARVADADWVCLPDGERGWIEVRDGGSRVRSSGPRTARRLDFGLFEGLPKERLVRIGSDAIARSPRLCTLGAREILVYRGGRDGKLPAVLGVSRSSRGDPRAIEALLRAWFTILALRARLFRDAEDRRHLRIGREAACIAHDLGHHLTLASLEIERSLAAVPPAADAGLRRAASALGEARELCERSVAGVPLEARDERVGLLELLRRASEDAAAVHGRADRVVLDVRCPADLSVRADRGLLGRLVRNLVLNALEATPDGRVVQVHARRPREGEIAITVLDPGRGMTAERRAELLRFGRSGSGGRGVGSASVEACARLLGTTLELESRPGSGTRVRFLLLERGKRS